jgi:hypothetical protein
VGGGVGRCGRRPRRRDRRERGPGQAEIEPRTVWRCDRRGHDGGSYCRDPRVDGHAERSSPAPSSPSDEHDPTDCVDDDARDPADRDDSSRARCNALVGRSAAAREPRRDPDDPTAGGAHDAARDRTPVDDDCAEVDHHEADDAAVVHSTHDDADDRQQRQLSAPR